MIHFSYILDSLLLVQGLKLTFYYHSFKLPVGEGI